MRLLLLLFSGNGFSSLRLQLTSPAQTLCVGLLMVVQPGQEPTVVVSSGGAVQQKQKSHWIKVTNTHIFRIKYLLLITMNHTNLFRFATTDKCYQLTLLTRTL